jgi:outer membrane protein assembly factor BamB
MRLTHRLRVLAGLAALVVPLGVVAATPADGAPVAPSQWPQFGQSARHLNVSTEQAFNPGNVGRLRTLFTADFGSNTLTEGGPAVANGMMYVAGFDGALNAYSVKGCSPGKCAPVWRGVTDNDITSTPAVAGGLVLIGSADHFLYAFPAAGCGAATCAPTWKAQLAAAVIDSSVAVANGVAYVGDFAGHLYAFTAAGCGAATCRPLWVGQGQSNELVGAPAVGNGFVYATTFLNTPDLFTGRLLVFPAAGCGRATCAPSWTADIGGPAGSTAAPAVTADTVYTTSGTLFGEGVNTNFHLMAFAAAGCHAKTCKPLRTYDTGDGGAGGAPAVSGGLLFATTQFTPDPNTVGVVSAYPAAGCGQAQCEPLWSGIDFTTGSMSPPSVANGVVFIGKGPSTFVPPENTPDAALYAFNAAGCGAATCRAISTLELSTYQFYLGAPVAIAEGKVFMASNDNLTGRSNVYGIGLSG